MVVPYKNNSASKKDQVAGMFTNISPKYDLLNHLLSMGIDIHWRNKAIELLRADEPKQILDIATGTGDLAITAMKLYPEKITGIDISEGMLEVGRVKIKKLNLEQRIELLYGDSENLKFENNKFDAITVAFGVRNFENLEKGLDEMYRVLKPGGKAVILEFSKPKAFPFKQLYNFYFQSVLPLIGKMISKDTSAYTYLPESVNAFPDGNDFVVKMARSGFKDTQFIPLTLGICAIYVAKK